MRTLKNNQEFYEHLDKICSRLRLIGMSKEADQIYYLLHKVAWTSSSELFEELELVFKNLLSASNATKIPQELKKELIGYIEILSNVQ